METQKHPVYIINVADGSRFEFVEQDVTNDLDGKFFLIQRDRTNKMSVCQEHLTFDGMNFYAAVLTGQIPKSEACALNANFMLGGFTAQQAMSVLQ